MRRYRIGTECVEQQQIEVRVRRTLKLQPAVTNNDIAIGSTSRKKSEESPRDRFHGWVDFKECHVMRSVRIRSHGPRSKPKNAEMLSLVPAAHHFDDVTHRSTGEVIRQWFAGTS